MNNCYTRESIGFKVTISLLVTLSLIGILVLSLILGISVPTNPAYGTFYSDTAQVIDAGAADPLRIPVQLKEAQTNDLSINASGTIIEVGKSGVYEINYGIIGEIAPLPTDSIVVGISILEPGELFTENVVTESTRTIYVSNTEYSGQITIALEEGQGVSLTLYAVPTVPPTPQALNLLDTNGSVNAYVSMVQINK